MSEVDRLSNSGLYPALPIADKRPSRDGSGDASRNGRRPPDPSAPKTGGGASTGSPSPPKSLIDEYA
jgi:hypothetical protein